MARPSTRSDDPTRPRLPAGFGVIWVTVAIDLIGFGIVIPILPRYAEDFGASPAAIGLLVASFSLAQMVVSPIMGRVSDRIGRKPVLIVSLCGTAVGSLLTGLAGSLWVLFLGRIIDGASGASVSVAQAAVTDLADPRQRPRLLGLLGAAFGVGFVIGPALGALAALRGPALPFFVAAAIAAVNAAVAVRRLPETRPRVPGAGAATAAPDPRQGEGEAPSGVGGPTEPSEDRAHLRRLAVAAFCSIAAFSGFEATFALLGERRLDLTLSSTGAVFAVIGLALVGVQGGLVGRVNGALGEDRTLRLGLGANGLGLLLLVPDGGWGTVGPALALLVLGQGLLGPTLASAASHRAGDARGRWMGWQQSAGAAARVVGPSVAGFLFGVGMGLPYLVGAVLVSLALALLPASLPRPTATT